MTGPDSDARFHSEEPWRPQNPQEELVDEQWRKQLGFGLSELDLTREEVGLMANPFRSTREGKTFDYFLMRGLIHSPGLEPVSLEEGNNLTPLEATQLMVARLDGKEHVSRYLKDRLKIFRAFRSLMDQMMEEDPEFRSTLGLDKPGPRTYSE